MKRNRRVFSIVLSFYLGHVFCVNSQTINYNTARQFAMERNYFQANEICDSLLKINPHFPDVLVLKARIYGWKQQYDQAREILDTLEKHCPGHYDMYDAFSDVEYWDLQYAEALSIVNNALGIYENDSLFLVKKKLLESLLSDTVTVGYSCSNYLFFQYYFDAFNEYYKRRWNVFTIGKPVNFYDKYLLLPKINLGYLAPIEGIKTYNALQLESDFFYVPDSSYYLYANAGLANYRLFPNYKFAFEYFMSYLYHTELSFGLRYMHWDQHNVFGTVSISKYWGNYWMMFRPYIPFRNFGEANAYLFTVRRYATEKQYVGLSYVFGAAPDQSFDQFIEHGAFNSHKIMAYGEKKLNDRYRLNLSFSYSNEEYRLNQHQNRFDFLVGITYCY